MCRTQIASSQIQPYLKYRSNKEESQGNFLFRQVRDSTFSPQANTLLFFSFIDLPYICLIFKI